MSLFERPGFEWRETFFVLFDESNRPSPADVEKTLKNLGARMEIGEIRTDDQDRVEAVTYSRLTISQAWILSLWAAKT